MIADDCPDPNDPEVPIDEDDLEFVDQILERKEELQEELLFNSAEQQFDGFAALDTPLVLPKTFAHFRISMGSRGPL